MGAVLLFWQWEEQVGRMQGKGETGTGKSATTHGEQTTETHGEQAGKKEGDISHSGVTYGHSGSQEVGVGPISNGDTVRETLGIVVGNVLHIGAHTTRNTNRDAFSALGLHKRAQPRATPRGCSSS